MKFISTQENLNQGINNVYHLAGRSIGLPILSNILMEVKDGVLNLSATNLEIGIKTEVRGKVEKEGSFTVNAKVIADYVSILPNKNIEIELINNQLLIKCENFQTKIRGQIAEEFPIIPVLEEKNKIKIDNNLIKNALEQTTFATSFDEMRPEINGVLFKINKKQLIIVATDSYRLTEKKIKIEEKNILESNYKENFIIPLKTLQEIERIITNNQEDVEFFLNENQVMFKIKPTLIISRLIEGSFPDYKQIIPQNFTTEAKINKNDFIQAVRAASLFARSGINDVNLRFLPEKKKLEIRTINPQLGEQNTSLDINISGKEVLTTFNYKYLLDGLQVFKGDKVVLAINSSTTPVILKDIKDENYLYLIMPIKQ